VPERGGVWADLGCGDGIFTSALFLLIQEEGEIYTVDRNRSALHALSRNFRGSFPRAKIHPVRADFTEPLSLPALDGILMANSLHFIVDKIGTLTGLKNVLKPGGRLIVVEYNTRRGNFAVPHPIDEDGFLRLMAEVGFKNPQIISRIPSTFLGEMYAGLGFFPPDGSVVR
jgi:ubiquinone/menaquinone biosynthesis C-methylase UbiE